MNANTQDTNTRNVGYCMRGQDLTLRGEWADVPHKCTDVPRSGTTRTGYGAKLATRHMLYIANRWRRVYAMCFANAGTCYVNISGQKYVIEFYD